MDGRDPSKRNASINGVYALLEQQLDGMPAYKLVGDGHTRFLFFNSEKTRWKVSDVLGDAKKGFAYVKVAKGELTGPHAPALKGSWEVFDGKEEGYSVDSAVSCSLVASGCEIGLVQQTLDEHMKPGMHPELL